MTSRIQCEIAEIKNLLLRMSALVEEAVRTAVHAWQKGDVELAQRVIDQDREIDASEMRIDSLALKTLALQQPMAVDLRFLTSAQQIAAQLERVGDHAVNIAEQVHGLMKREPGTTPVSTGLNEMAGVAIQMLADSINAFVYGDAVLAHAVRDRDNEVDDLYSEIVQGETATMERDPQGVRPGLYHIILALNVERIGDLATNIAEDVIFLVEGRILRHEGEKGVEEGPVGPVPPGRTRREPLECLENHALTVHQCLEKAVEAVHAYMENNTIRFVEFSNEVNELEHAADLIKRNVRAHLPKGIIMPIDKFELFFYLNEQDAIADTAEDMLEWIAYRRVSFPSDVQKGIATLLAKCLETTKDIPSILHAARTYFQTADEKVRVHVKDAIRAVRVKEHDADVIEHELKKAIFSSDLDSLSVTYLIRLAEIVGRSADHAENAMDILRSMIAR